MISQVTASRGNYPAPALMGCLNAAIDASGQPRKALADELGVSEQTFSKMTAGVQAFGLHTFEACSDEVVFDTLARWGKVRGFRIERVDTDRQIAELITMFEQGVSALVIIQRQREMREAKERKRA